MTMLPGGSAEAFFGTPPEAKEYEALLVNALDVLVKEGRITPYYLIYLETDVINGEPSWVFESSSGNYAVSKTGKIYIFVQVDYILLEDFYEQADASKKSFEKFLVGVLTADVTGNNVNIRKEPNANGDVLLKVSKSAGNVVVAEKIAVKDSSGQDWYKVLYYYDEGMFIGTYENAYISGQYIKTRDITGQEKSDLKFRFDRDV
jgi:hypothetical protein